MVDTDEILPSRARSQKAKAKKLSVHKKLCNLQGTLEFIAEDILRISAAAAEITNVPILAGIIKIALEILSIIKKTNDLQCNCYQLVEDSVTYTVSISEVTKSIGDIPQPIKSYVEGFKEVLAEILCDLRTIVRQRFITRLFSLSSVTTRVEEHSAKLERCYNVLMEKLAIHTACVVQQMAERMNEVKLDNAAQMVFGHSFSNQTSSLIKTEYRGVEALQFFQADLEYHRKAYMQQLLGFSTPFGSLAIPLRITVEYISNSEGLNPLQVFQPREAVTLVHVLETLPDAISPVDNHGILIKARHLGYRKNVLGLCSFNAQEHSFVSPISNKYITVEEYFLEAYKIQLKYPLLPLVKVGPRNFLPPEICEVLGKRDFVTRKVQNPHNPTTGEQRLTTAKERETLVSKLQFFDPATMLLPREYLIQCWAVLFIYDGSQVDYSQTESQGLLGAINRLTTTHLPGIISPQTHPSLLSVRLEAGDQVSEVLQRCLRGNEQPNFEFYMIILPHGGKKLYTNIKEYFRDLNVPVQCVQQKTFRGLDGPKETKMFSSITSQVLEKIVCWKHNSTNGAE